MADMIFPNTLMVCSHRLASVTGVHRAGTSARNQLARKSDVPARDAPASASGASRSHVAHHCRFGLGGATRKAQRPSSPPGRRISGDEYRIKMTQMRSIIDVAG